MSHTVIIPSKTFANLIVCASAVWNHDPGSSMIVVDDGIGWREKDVRSAKVIPGIKPFVYARNCNLGIQACDDDVILLNDDAILETPGGFKKLEALASSMPEHGLISAVTDVAGNLAQRPRRIGLRDEARVVAFICVYIPRRTIDQVGLLDERFTAYGWEDNDYCRRVRNAGLKLGIFDGCFVNHSRLKSSFRGRPHDPGDIAAGRQIYVDKWGDVR